eukprot:CAMPEP_0180139008 /NCGR_PEP_ID=MMETSP0986-20121125/13268_1 /TAXON_ID=697907 /ORGANISM="non described non described, Strain CCMP2293" /LENGTH=36 /DNA_ID= /DNA_START= /DNA_END= /DNA_ORIENTATION=
MSEELLEDGPASGAHNLPPRADRPALESRDRPASER